MDKTGRLLLLLATLTGCGVGRTPLLKPPAGKPDASLKASDAGVDRPSDRGLPDVRPEAPDIAPDRAPDLGTDTSRPDSGPDRAGDLLLPDTRPPSPDLVLDRALDRQPPDVRLLDTRPPSPDLAPDRARDLVLLDLPILTPDVVPDRPLDSPSADAPGPDLPSFEGLNLDQTLDQPIIDAALADAAIDAAALDAGSDGSASDTMAGCVPGTPYPLVLGQDQRLYRFDPTIVSLTDIAEVSCGTAGLNSLTASPLGAAYISNLGGELCALDVRTFQTTLTRFDPNLIGNVAYGMALLSDNSPRGQSLYIATNSSSSAELKVVNLLSYSFGDIAPIVPAVPRTELTAGPQNSLFALYPTQPSSLFHLDPLTANAIEVVTLPDSAFSSFALVYWEDSFYLFMEDALDAEVHNVYRYRTSDGRITLAGTLPVQIIGAGVALCQ
jgi:predicted small lipoprotein YifL